MSKTYKRKITIGGEDFNAYVTLTGEELDREGNLTMDVEMSFDPKDAERLGSVFVGFDPKDFGIGFAEPEKEVTHDN